MYPNNLETVCWGHDQDEQMNPRPFVSSKVSKIGEYRIEIEKDRCGLGFYNVTLTHSITHSDGQHCSLRLRGGKLQKQSFCCIQFVIMVYTTRNFYASLGFSFWCWASYIRGGNNPLLALVVSVCYVIYSSRLFRFSFASFFRCGNVCFTSQWLIFSKVHVKILYFFEAPPTPSFRPPFPNRSFFCNLEKRMFFLREETSNSHLLRLPLQRPSLRTIYLLQVTTSNCTSSSFLL